MSIYPACAGINLTILSADCENGNLPRMRGDQPNGYATCNAEKEFTPHARGLTRLPDQSSQCSAIYPACAGITLCRSSAMVLFSNLPRMRGDQPASGTDRADMPAFTPHARGSTSSIMSFITPMSIYPACAGITLSLLSLTRLSRIYPACAGINPAILSC